MTSQRGSQAPRVRGHRQVPTCTPILPYIPATQREENQGAPYPVPHLSALQMLSPASRGSLQPSLSPAQHVQSPCVRTLDLTASHLPTCQLTHLSTELAPTLKGHLQGQAFRVFQDGESCPPHHHHRGREWNVINGQMQTWRWRES